MFAYAVLDNASKSARASVNYHLVILSSETLCTPDFFHERPKTLIPFGALFLVEFLPLGVVAICLIVRQLAFFSH
jgi:hypothetical protein